MDDDTFLVVKRQILNNAVRRQQKSIDLGNKSLRHLPSEIGKAQTLIKLSVHFNELTTFPIEIGQLKNLIELQANQNNINELPIEIGNLVELKVLNLANNDLRSLTPAIGNFSNLEVLDLSGNPLEVLPIEISRLEKIVSLDLSNTSLSELPDVFRYFHRINSLDLSATNLENLPESIGSLQELTFLDVSHCSLSTLPESITSLRNLRFLNVSGNPLKTLPRNMPQLKELIYFNASYCNFKSSFGFLSEMLNLQNLHLSGLNGALLQGVRLNRNLHTLTLSNCDLIDLPEKLITSTVMRKVDVSQNHLRTFPKTILRSKFLLSLDVSENKIEEIPNGISNLRFLTDLDVGNNKIAKIPSSLIELSRLKSLNVENNLLEEIPKVIGFMPSLRRAVDIDVEPYSDAVYISGNPMKFPLNAISALEQPRATKILLTFLRGELDSETLRELENYKRSDLSEEVLDPPYQGPGPHFEIDESGLVNFTPPEDIDIEGNNVRRLRALHPILKELIGELKKGLSEGNSPHYHLLERLNKYADLVNQQLEAIDFSLAYAEGVRLANASEATKNAIRSGDLPEINARDKEALDSLLQIHSTFMMATKDGMEAIIEEERYSRNPQDELVFRHALVELAKSLQSEKKIIDRRAAEFIATATQELGKGTNPERSYVVASGAVRNASIVFATAGALAAISTVPGLSGFAMPAFVTTATNLIANKAIEKSKPFQELQKVLAEGIDATFDSVSIEKLKSISAMFLPYLKVMRSNEDRMRSLAAFGIKFDWTLPYFRWLRKYDRK